MIAEIADWLWGYPLAIMLIGTHVFLTIRLRFVQRYVGKGIKLSVRRDGSDGDISPFSALMTALAATIGTGNIVGVATAIALGGPGAVFWMWLTGIIGIATKYAESLLSIFYRVKNVDGSYSGGPMYVIERGLRCKWLAVAFAVFTILASFGIGSSIQANSITSAVVSIGDFADDSHVVYIVAVILCSITASVLLGGVKGVVNVCRTLVPIMGVFYIVCCLLIMAFTFDKTDDSLLLILRSAFNPSAAGGAFVGTAWIYTMRYGVSRGLFSNESGMGSAPIIAASAKTKDPTRQAIISATGTFWDTVVICALTGLTIVNTGAWNCGAEGMEMTKKAFEHIPFVGGLFLCVALITFAFSTILGWFCYAEKCVEYLMIGSRFSMRKAIIVYRVFYIVTVGLGCILSLKTVWALGDIFNGLMAIPNLISLFLLSGTVALLTRKHLST